MSAEIGAGDPATGGYDTLHAEAKQALAAAANTLRSVTERYREAFHGDLARWHAEGDALDRTDRRALADDVDAGGDEEGGSVAVAVPTDDGTAVDARRQVAVQAAALGARQTELARLELAVRALERTWLFLERGDASLLAEPALPDLAENVQMRTVEAREAERNRLAQEVHDGPAQALANAIFGVEYIEKVLEHDPRSVPTELRFMRERLRRELGDVRAFISQLRPPLLEELGLEGSIREAADTLAALTGAQVELDLSAPPAVLGEPEQVVVLRVMQEAIQNVRKHAGARRVWIATRLDGDRWVTEVRDDGRGFDADAVAAPGRRSFGIQVMRERAELVRGRFEVRSRPANGTVVVLDIPVGERGARGGSA